MNVGGDAIMSAGNDLNLKGGTQLNANGDIALMAGHDINIEAAKDTRSHDSQNYGGKFGFDIQGGGFTVGGNYGYEQGNGTTYTNTVINAGGNLITISDNDTIIKGGNLHGENVFMEAGGNLLMETLQDDNHFESKSASASVTFSMAGITGASASYAQADANSEWSHSISSITGNDRVEINVGNNTTLIGSMINSENGNLTLNTDTLTFKDLRESDKSSSISVSVSTSPGSGLAGGIGFGFGDDQKEAITRATIGEGAINTNSDISGLNRDINKVQEITYESHSGIHMTVPVVNPDRMVEEGKIVVPTAYAIYSTGWNALASTAISPLIALESLAFDGLESELTKNGARLEETPKYIIAAPRRAINGYDTAYAIGALAYEYNPEYLPALFGMNIPFLGTFIPGPEGDQSTRSTVWYFSGGIRDIGKDGSAPGRDPTTFAGFGLADGETGFSGHYPYGSGAEVFSELFLGNTAPGIEFFGEILKQKTDDINNQNNNSILLTGHSGGVMRSALASKYLGYAGIGVWNADFSQGPAWGYYNNVQNATSHLSVPGDVVSDMGIVSFPLFFINDSHVQLNMSVLGKNAIHAQPFTGPRGGSEFDKIFYYNLKENLQQGQLPNYPSEAIKYFQPYEKVNK